MYKQCYEAFGGSFITHPEVIRAISNLIDMPLDFKACYQSEKIAGYVALWGDYLAGDTSVHQENDPLCLVDLGNAEIILPLKPSGKVSLPAKGELLSERHVSQLNHLEESRVKALALAKNPYSGWRRKFRYNRARELQQFEASGGQYRSVRKFLPEEVASIYNQLFVKRHGFDAKGAYRIPELLETLFSWLCGYVLIVDEKPIAIQLVYGVESRSWLSYEFVNGAYDPEFSGMSPGSVLMYLNITQAAERARTLNKELRYSFGKFGSDYKSKWCYAAPVFKSQ